MSTSTKRTALDGQGSPATRRTFLQQMAVAGVAIGPGAAFLASCATGGGDGGDEETPSGGDASEENPFGMAEDGTLEIYIFDGGFGDEYATEIHEPTFSEKWPDVTIDHHAAVDIAGELQARFVAGDPPDFVNNSGDGQMDQSVLSADGQLYDLSPLWDAPSWDDPSKKVRDVVLPGTIEVGTFSGVPQILNYAFTVFGVWYNKTLLDENGWPVPTTWQEMMDVCADIAATGIAPWVYQGVTAPRYMNWPILAMAAKQAGTDVLLAIDMLEEGAWKHEAVVESANAIHMLAQNNYFLPNVAAMEFRDAQGLWARGQAVFCPSGSWLENEEKDAIAENPTFELAVMPDPLLDPSTAAMPLETVRATAGEPYLIPADAKNPQGAMEYMRAMLSLDAAKQFSQKVTSLTAVVGATDGVTFEQPGINSARTALEAAGDNVINWFYPTWYKTMENPGIDQVTAALLRNEINATQWAEQCEAVATATREDDSIVKQSREG